MSEKEQKKKGAGKAHAVAAWEWFKSAAWLQVLLIVGVVVGLVVAIPYVVQAIVSASNKNDSKFYENHNITYAQLEKYLTGEDKSCNGIIGDATGSDFKVADDKEGFVVLFYKDNCDGCKSIQANAETWYNNFNGNKDQGNGKLKFYTINCSWIPGDDNTGTKEGTFSYYDNSNITLQQQFDVQQAIKTTYLNQDSTHQNSSVSETTLNSRLDGETDGGTLPTPLFVTFTKDKSAANYITDAAGYEAAGKSADSILYTTPAKAISGPIGSLDINSPKDVAVMMLDIYNFAIYKK